MMMKLRKEKLNYYIYYPFRQTRFPEEEEEWKKHLSGVLFCIDLKAGLKSKKRHRLSKSWRNVDLKVGKKDKMDPTKVKFEGVGWLKVSESRSFIKALERRKVKLLSHLLG